MNHFPFHIGDYAEATGHLSFVEDSAYLRCIRKYYSTEKPLPPDIKAVQRLVGARSKDELQAVETVLKEFFTLSEDGWHNDRCDIELSIYFEKSDKAKASANARWKSSDSNAKAMRTHTERNAPIDANAYRTQCEGNANQEPIANNHIKNKSITPPIGVDVNVWNDFVSHRKNKKSPISATALKGIESEAVKANMTLQAALALCVMRGWTGFKAEWVAEKPQASSSYDRKMKTLSGLTGGIHGSSSDAVFKPITETKAIDMESPNANLLG